MRWRRASRTVVIVVVIAFVVAACSKTSTPPTSAVASSTTTTAATSTTATPPAAKPPPPTQWDAVSSHIGADGQLDLSGTRLAFSLLFQPLPGVTLPSGAATSDLHSDGSLVARSVLAHWKDLSPADRRIMAPYFSDDDATSTGTAPNPSSTTTTGPTTSTTAGKVRRRGRHSSPRVVLASDVHRKGPTRPPPTPKPAAVKWVADQVWAIAQGEASKLGIAPPDRSRFDVRFSSAEYVEKSGKSGEADLWTVLVGDPYQLDANTDIVLTGAQATHCIIFLSPHVWRSIAGKGAASASLTEQLAHEVFHCYEGLTIGQDDLKLFWAQPSWLIEGGAAWAGADYAETNEGYDSWFRTWLQHPGTSLLRRDYDAIGFFSTLQRLGGLPWTKWQFLFNEIRNNSITDGDTIYHSLTQGVKGLGQAWAPAYARRKDWADDWDQSGIGIGPWQPSVVQEDLEDGSHLTVEANAYSAAERDLYATTPLIVTVEAIQPTDHHGLIRIHDADTLDEIAEPTTTFCLGGSCACDVDATTGAPPGDDATGVVRLAVSGLDTGQAVRVTAKADDKDCSYHLPPGAGGAPPGGGGTATDPNSPGGSDCQGNCGASNGDPHLTTISGFHYDMQGAGELVMLESGSTFALQTRDVTHAGENPKFFTFNLSVAMRFGPHRVTVTGQPMGDAAPVVRVDGGVVTPPARAGDGVEITEDGGSVVTVKAADGITVTIRPLFNYGEHLLVDVPKRMVASMRGLLAADHSRALAARDGHLVALVPPQGGLALAHQRDLNEYHDLVESWRVTPAESAFDYGPGESTKTFTDRSVPDLGHTPTKAELAAAFKACTGVTPTWLRNECAYDLAATRDPSVIASYRDLVPGHAAPAGTSSHVYPRAVRPGDTVPVQTYAGSISYHIVITRTGYIDLNYSVGCFGGVSYEPGLHNKDQQVRTILTGPGGAKGLDTPVACNDDIGVSVLTPGTYTLTVRSVNVPHTRMGFTVSPVRAKQFTR